MSQSSGGALRNPYSFFKYYDQTICAAITPDRSPLFNALPADCFDSTAIARLQECGNISSTDACTSAGCSYIDDDCTDPEARTQAEQCAAHVQVDASQWSFESETTPALQPRCTVGHQCKDECFPRDADTSCTYTETLLITVNYRYSCGFQPRGDAVCSYAFTAGERIGQRIIQEATLLPDDDCP
eukprot:SAG22_NODE_8588_length_643_cov_0.781250_1_plen_184_part_01